METGIIIYNLIKTPVELKEGLSKTLLSYPQGLS
jgi:hypothetical protein